MQGRTKQRERKRVGYRRMEEGVMKCLEEPEKIRWKFDGAELI